MIKDKIKSFKELKKVIAAAKKRKKKIVFTNGCFELLHLGHLRCLEKARSSGDILVVAVNSDASVRRLKGASHPIITGRERATLVAALADVDYVTVFGQATPLNLIKTLKPDILVKGGDWRKSDIVGKDFVESYGGKVVRVNFVKGHSCTSIITRIKQGQ